MDVRINEVQSRVQTTDSQSLLDPRTMQEIVRACVRAVKEELTRDKRIKEELSLTSDDGQDR
jgi:predicted proteasome-type protease